MAKLNNTQQQIVNAMESYKNGSTAVVRAFEMAVHGYWFKDSCNPVNIEFFLNASKRFPRLQTTAKVLLAKFGKFEIKASKSNSGDTLFTVKNGEACTKEEKKQFRAAINEFIAMEYTSLMHEKSIKIDIEWNEAKSAQALKASINKQIRDYITSQGEGADLAFLKKMAQDTISSMFADTNITKIKEDINKTKAKAA